MPIYMNVTGQDKSSFEFLEIASFSFGVNNTETVGSDRGGASGKVKFNEMTITKQNDKSSPMLFQSCASGHLLPAVQLVLFTGEAGAANVYLEYQLKDALVTSMQWGSGGDNPSETISFAFDAVSVQYTTQEGRTNESAESLGSFWYVTGQPPLL